MKMKLIAVLALAAAWAPVAAQAATLEEVLAACDAKIAELESATADVTMTMEGEQMGTKVEMKGTGKTWFLKEDGVDHMRSEMKIEMKLPGMGEMSQDMTTIAVGDKSLILTEMMGMKMAMRDQDDEAPFAKLSLGSQLAELKEDNTLIVQDDAEVGGEPVYVIRVEPKNIAPEEPLGAQVLHLSKANGLPVKIVLYDQQDQAIGEILSENIQVNVPVEKSRFDMTIPEGYQEVNPGGF